MDTLFLGIRHAVPRSVSWIYGRKDQQEILEVKFICSELVKYANMIGRYRGLVNNYQRMIQNLNEYSTTLIPYLKKEYHVQ